MTIWLVLFVAVFVAGVALVPNWFPSVLLVASLAFSRPGVASIWYDDYGLALAVLAGLLSLGRRRSASPASRALLFAWWGSVALYISLIFHSAVILSEDSSALWTSAVSTMLPVGCWLVVLTREQQAKRVMTLLVMTATALSASYLITVGFWLGGDASVAYQFPERTGGSATLYFPVTPVLSEIEVSSRELPRGTGLMWEPGMWALFLGVSMLFVGTLQKGRRIARVVLVLGIVGTFSTAGFAGLVVVLAWHAFLRPGYSGLRRTLGVFVSAGAVWAALFTPLLGVANKADTNAGSLEARRLATEAGLAALRDAPFVGTGSSVDHSAVNLIASVAPFGIWVLLAVLFMLWAPMRLGTSHPSGSSAVFFITIILMTSQPVIDCSGVIALILLVHAQAPPPSPVPPDGSPPVEGLARTALAQEIARSPNFRLQFKVALPSSAWFGSDRWTSSVGA